MSTFIPSDHLVPSTDKGFVMFVVISAAVVWAVYVESKYKKWLLFGCCRFITFPALIRFFLLHWTASLSVLLVSRGIHYSDMVTTWLSIVFRVICTDDLSVPYGPMFTELFQKCRKENFKPCKSLVFSIQVYLQSVFGPVFSSVFLEFFFANAAQWARREGFLQNCL